MQQLSPQIKDEPSASWGMGDAVAGFLLAQFIAVSLVLALPRDEEGRSFEQVIAALGGQWIGFLAIVLYASYRKGRRSLNADFGLRAKWSDAPIGLGIGVAAQLVMVPLLYVPLRFFFPGSFDDVSATARELTDFPGWQFGVIAVAVVLGAAFFEELFFRGLTQRSIAKRFGPLVGLVVTGVLFGLVHFNFETGSAATLPPLIAFGLILSYIANHTGRLGMNIWAHIGFNLVTVVALYVSRFGEVTSPV